MVSSGIKESKIGVRVFEVNEVFETLLKNTKKWGSKKTSKNDAKKGEPSRRKFRPFPLQIRGRKNDEKKIEKNYGEGGHTHPPTCPPTRQAKKLDTFGGLVGSPTAQPRTNQPTDYLHGRSNSFTLSVLPNLSDLLKRCRNWWKESHLCFKLWQCSLTYLNDAEIDASKVEYHLKLVPHRCENRLKIN